MPLATASSTLKPQPRKLQQHRQQRQQHQAPRAEEPLPQQQQQQHHNQQGQPFKYGLQMEALLKLQDHQQQGEPSVVVAPTISTTSERTPPKSIVVRMTSEPGARRKTSIRPYVAATFATERRVKTILDKEKEDPGW